MSIPLIEVSPREDLRISALSRYRLLDTPPEAAFDRITRRAAKRLDAPFALFSLVDRDRVFIKSRFGLDLQQLKRMPRRRHTPLLPDETLWLTDAEAYDCFRSLEGFDAAELIRFYAAAPLVTYDGFTLGTLSVMDHKPRDEDHQLKSELGQIAGSLMKEIETRRLLRRLETLESESDKASNDEPDDAPPGPQAPMPSLVARDELFDRLGRELERSRRHNVPDAALLVLAIDRFMAINGSLGYATGDRVLNEVARRLEHSVPAGTLAARLGGDAFAVLTDGRGDAEDARQLAEEIQQRLCWPMRLDGRRVSVSASIGIASLDEGYTRPDEVVRDAEIAMSHAKANGGARHELFNAHRHGPRVQQLELEAELRGALGRGELRLHYQPIIELESGALRGFEALVRWQHPRHGLLRPKDFLALADAIGMMPAITEWTLEHACHQLAEWQRRFPQQSAWSMSINIDARHLTRPDFADKIDRVLGASELRASSVNLEVTETAMMSSSPEATAILGRLRDRGLALHIDDFGTGYATLSYLHRVPGRALKIDATFVTEMTGDPRHHEIVRSIVDLAHKLGLEVIAEGVETPLHLQALRDLGCDHGQGFYFSRPLDPASLEELLSAETAWIEEIHLS